MTELPNCVLIINLTVTDQHSISKNFPTSILLYETNIECYNWINSVHSLFDQYWHSCFKILNFLVDQ